MKIILTKDENNIFNLIVINLLILCVFLTEVNIKISILLFILINIIEIRNKIKIRKF